LGELTGFPAVRFRLLPTDDKFFDLFSEAAGNAADCARNLRELIDDDARSLSNDRVVESEHRGDELTKQILLRLDSTFVTPLDREDIHALAEELDDVVDDMLSVAARLRLTVQGPVIPELKRQAELLVRMADEMVQLIDNLQSMKGINPHLEAIDRLESEGDQVYREALGRLFDGVYDALDVLRWKDIVEAMELALNTIEDVSNVVESIVLKHA
jgi:predicted phosphate transport protein (TIGR00153 family)